MGYMVKGDPAPGRAEGAIDSDPALPRVCVIGAGSAGLAAVKALYEARIPFDCFEMSSAVGGLWVFQNPNGRSGCYQTLEMNTSGPRMAYSDFPVPDYYPDYPMHWQVREYFDRFVDHFGLREQITFETKVERVTPSEDGGGYEVEVSGAAGAEDGGERRTYDRVIVCNGHHWDPRWPDPAFPGSFEGTEMHAHDFRDKSQLEGRKVVILGVGNSGMDIACASSYVADQTTLAHRRGAHVIRKTLAGRPVDQTLLPAWLPWSVKQKGFELLRKLSGDVADHGMAEPDHKVGHAHPTLSNDFYDRLADGQITPKPNIAELRGDRVAFTDGTEVEADLIIYSTGYKVSFPFFDPEFVSAPGNDLPLYRRTFHPRIDDLYFIGLAQPLGALMPVAEAQATWIADHIRSRYALPTPAAMADDISAERQALAKRFYSSDRHTMEIDFDDWIADVEAEREAGGKRTTSFA